MPDTASELAKLIQQVTAYEHGYRPEGQRDIDKAGKVLGMVGDIGTQIQGYAKQALEMKMQELKNTEMKQKTGPARNLFGIASPEQAQSQQTTRVPQNVFPQPTAELQGTASQQVGPANPFAQQAVPTPAPVAPMVSQRERFQAAYPHVNLDAPMDASKDVASIETAYAKPQTTNEDLMPATNIYTPSYIKSVFPEATDRAIASGSIKVGQVKSAVTTGNQKRLDEDRDENRKNLEFERNERRIERINTTALGYSDKLENNYLIKQLSAQGIGLETANELDELAASGNTVAGAALGMKQAKGMGEVGVITDADVKRYIESGKLTQRAADILNRWRTGAPTPATLEEITQINAVIQAKMAEKVQPIYDKYINRLSANFGISKEEAAERLDVPYGGSKQGVPKSDVGGGDVEAKKAALRQKLGLK